MHSVPAPLKAAPRPRRSAWLFARNSQMACPTRVSARCSATRAAPAACGNKIGSQRRRGKLWSECIAAGARDDGGERAAMKLIACDLTRPDGSLSQLRSPQRSYSTAHHCTHYYVHAQKAHAHSLHIQPPHSTCQPVSRHSTSMYSNGTASSTVEKSSAAMTAQLDTNAALDGQIRAACEPVPSLPRPGS